MLHQQINQLTNLNAVKQTYLLTNPDTNTLLSKDAFNHLILFAAFVLQ